MTVLGCEAFERADRDRFVQDASAAGALARGGADPSAHRRERVDLGGDGVRLVITPRSDEPDVAAGIRAGRAGHLARRLRDGGPVLLHRPPDVPGLGVLGRLPRQQVAPRRRMVALEDLSGHARQRQPRLGTGGGRLGTVDRSLARRERRLARFGDEGHDDDRAFADADPAADALTDLDRVLHHPCLRAADAGRLDAGHLGPRHVECLDRTGVHADAAVDAARVVDIDAITHELASIQVTCRASAMALRRATPTRMGGVTRMGRATRAIRPGPPVTPGRRVPRAGRASRPLSDSGHEASRGCCAGGT